MGDAGSIPGSGILNTGNPLQYSCLENPMGKGAWRATVRGVAKSDATGRRDLPLTHLASAIHQDAQEASARCPVRKLSCLSRPSRDATLFSVGVKSELLSSHALSPSPSQDRRGHPLYRRVPKLSAGRPVGLDTSLPQQQRSPRRAPRPASPRRLLT